MNSDDLDYATTLNLSAGHLLVVWDVLANKLSGAPFIKELAEEERRAIWALQDLCEDLLSRSGFGSRPEQEWNALMTAARAHVSTIPVEFLD
ncbi:MAG: hypothetical protein QM776_04515 [Rhodocyclaceae bacterium]